LSDTQAEPRRTRLSAVWLIPLAAALIGLWLVFSYLSSQGPVITLTLADAEGINAGKTPVKTRNVQVGLVESVRLSDDMSHTLLTVQMQSDTDRMLARDTRFWVVKPRISREGVSGLNTVLSGSYIELMPGESSKKGKRFQVQDSPPPETTGAGLFLKLVSAAGTNVDVGDPVNFRSLKVGRVVETRFNAADKRFHHRIFIQKPYDVLVSDSSRFWQVNGLGFQLDARGFQAQIHSLEALIGGGITFAVPDGNMRAGDPVEDEREFTLHNDEESARRALYTDTLDYVLLVERSVRGLKSGAPVEYRGIRVGTVEQVAWGFGQSGPATISSAPIPVLIRLEPQRITHQNHEDTAQWRQEIDRMIGDGLRASLKPGNLLTGSLFVDLDFHPESPANSGGERYADLAVFPTVNSGGISKIEDQIQQLLDTLNDLPMESIAGNLNRNLDNLADATRRLDTLLANPALNALPERLTGTLGALEGTLQGWQSGGEGYQQLQGTLQKLDRLLNEAEPLLDTLNRQPNALIFQRQPAPDPQPRGPRQ